MTKNWEKIWDGFHTVAEAASGDREELLDRVCRGDIAIRSEIESLLAAAEQSGDFLDRPAAVDLTVADGVDDDDAPGVGSDIGPYHLVEELGEGGMGVVYRARQESPIRREVALKLIRAGLDSREVVARFEAERQALALMNHPNIARVFDAGATPDGRPYFVMELAPGAHITRYCDEHRLGIREPHRACRHRLPGGAARPPHGDHPSRSQTVEHHRRLHRRKPGAQSDRLRCPEGHRTRWGHAGRSPENGTSSGPPST